MYPPPDASGAYTNPVFPSAPPPTGTAADLPPYPGPNTNSTADLPPPPSYDSVTADKKETV